MARPSTRGSPRSSGRGTRTTSSSATTTSRPPDATSVVTEGARLRVVIAEDSALIREGLARLIEENGGTVVAKVSDGDAFVAAAVEHRPDVSVVDVRMPPSQRDEGLRAAI